MAYLVASVFEENTVLCIGKSAALQPEKLQRARFVADLLGELFLSQVVLGMRLAWLTVSGLLQAPLMCDSARHSLCHQFTLRVKEGGLWAAACTHFGVRSVLFCLPDVLHLTAGLDLRGLVVRTASPPL